jgi:hypothetical protein
MRPTRAWTLLLVLSFSPAHAATLVRLDENASEDLHTNTSIAIGSDGMPRVAWANAGDNTFRFATCTTLDCSESGLETVAGAVGTSGSMVLDAGDGMLLAYYDDTERALAFDDGVVRPIDDPADDVGMYASLVLDGAGRAVIAYDDLSNESLRLAACADSACTSVSIVTVDDDPLALIGGHVDVAIGADGLPVMAYAVMPGGSLRVAKCEDATCASRTIHDLDQPSVGQFASIAIGADGNPIASYYDFHQNGALKVAKCTDAACVQPAIVSLLDDRGRQVGVFNAIAIRPDGNPVISYRRCFFDAVDCVLAVAECRTPDCSGPVDLLTVDHRDDEIVGDNTDIRIGADGAAVISYYDETTSSVHFAKCSVQTCAATGDGVFISGFEGSN